MTKPKTIDVTQSFSFYGEIVRILVADSCMFNCRKVKGVLTLEEGLFGQPKYSTLQKRAFYVISVFALALCCFLHFPCKACERVVGDIQGWSFILCVSSTIWGMQLSVFVFFFVVAISCLLFMLRMLSMLVLKENTTETVAYI